MPRSAVENWRLEWLTTWNEVWDTSFVNWWQELIDQSPDAHVFFEPCIVRAWYETYRELRRIEPRFLIARSDSDCKILFPLVFDHGTCRDAWQRVIHPVGCLEFDYHDPVCANLFPKSGWTNFWRQLIQELQHRRFRFDWFSIPRVQEQCVQGAKGFNQVERAPLIDLSKFKSYDDLLSQLSQNMRQGVRRKRRRLERMANVRLRVFGKNEIRAALATIPTFRRAHQIQWPQSYRAPSFYERLVALAIPKGLLHLSTLECGERAISWHIGFMHKGRFYWYVPAYDASMSRYSPGQMHLAKLVEETMAKGITVFDFLRGEEPYKMQWTSQTTPLYSLSQASRGVRSAAKNFWQQSVKPRLRAANHFCPWRDR